MQPIKDIRIYRSTIENIPGNSLPEGFYNQELCAVARRIVMKLQENGFSMGDFHHLYINMEVFYFYNIVLFHKFLLITYMDQLHLSFRLRGS